MRWGVASVDDRIARERQRPSVGALRHAVRAAAVHPPLVPAVHRGTREKAFCIHERASMASLPAPTGSALHPGRGAQPERGAPAERIAPYPRHETPRSTPSKRAGRPAGCALHAEETRRAVAACPRCVVNHLVQPEPGCCYGDCGTLRRDPRKTQPRLMYIGRAGHDSQPRTAGSSSRRRTHPPQRAPGWRGSRVSGSSETSRAYARTRVINLLLQVRVVVVGLM